MPVVYVASSRRDRQRGRIASIIPKPSGSTRRRAKMKIGFFFSVREPLEVATVSSPILNLS